MKPAYALALTILFSPLFIYMSCRRTATTNPPEDCRAVMCTMEFRSVTVKVVDAAGNPVVLDEVHVTRVKTGEHIKHENAAVPEQGYIVLDDGYRGKLVHSTADFRFVGMKDGKEVVNELYSISADCCHINKQSGKAEVVVN